MSADKGGGGVRQMLMLADEGGGGHWLAYVSKFT